MRQELGFRDMVVLRDCEKRERPTVHTFGPVGPRLGRKRNEFLSLEASATAPCVYLSFLSQISHSVPREVIFYRIKKYPSKIITYLVRTGLGREGRSAFFGF